MNPILKQLLDKGRKTPNKSSTCKIIVGNSYCLLDGFPDSIVEVVKKALTYKNTEAEYERMKLLGMMRVAKNMGNKRLFHGYRVQLEKLPPEFTCWLLSGNRFPSGLLSLVQDTLKANRFDSHSIIDKRIKPDPYLVLKWQKELRPMRYYQHEMTAISDVEPRGVFIAATRSGKTRIFTEIIKRKEVTTLVVVTSKPLVTQVTDVLVEALGKTKVGAITTDTIKKKKKLPAVRVVLINTLAALQKSGTIQELIGDVDMIILDEFHHAGAASYTDLLPEIDHIYYRYGFTATFMRNDSKLMDMLGFLSKVLYEYPAQQAIKDGYITPVTLKVIRARGQPGYTYQKEYEKNYCGSLEILSWIHKILMHIGNDNQILILVDRKDKAGAIIHKFLITQGFKTTYISGDDKQDVIASTIKRFNECKINILIASTVLGEGVDIQSAKHLIMARGGKSEIAFTQAAARCLTLYPGKSESTIYDILFVGCKFLEKHARMRSEIFIRQFGGIVSEFNQFKG